MLFSQRDLPIKIGRIGNLQKKAKKRAFSYGKIRPLEILLFQFFFAYPLCPSKKIVTNQYIKTKVFLELFEFDKNFVKEISLNG